MNIKAKFSQLTAKQGKTVIQMELDEACNWALPELATMAGRQVLVGIEDPQQQMDVDGAAVATEPEPVAPLLLE